MKSPVEIIRLARRYSLYITEPEANAYLAWARLGQIIRGLPPTQAFDLACHIIRSLPDSYLQAFGGGTVAHLIQHHGATLIDWIEAEAWRDVDFLEALSSAWIAGEDVPPAVLVRLGAATGARIHAVSGPERDARYKTTFERWRTRRPYRRSPPPRTSRVEEYALESFGDGVTLSKVATAVPPADGEAKNAPPVTKRLWWVRFAVPYTRLQIYVSTKPRLVRYMAQGALTVWLQWFLATAFAARLLLPTLLVALFITSVSPVADLLLVAAAFVLATAGAALTGLLTGIANQRRGRVGAALPYFAVISLIPYLTAIVLLARTEHGFIVVPAVLVGLVTRQLVWRFFRRARTTLRHHPSRA